METDANSEATDVTVDTPKTTTRSQLEIINHKTWYTNNISNER